MGLERVFGDVISGLGHTISDAIEAETGINIGTALAGITGMKNSSGEFDWGTAAAQVVGGIATIFCPPENRNQVDMTRGYAQAMGKWDAKSIHGGDPRLDEFEKSLQTVKDNFKFFDVGGVIPEDLGELASKFNGFEEAKADGRISMHTLQLLADNPNVPEDLRKAAQFLCEHRDMMLALDVAGNIGLKDGDFTFGNLEVMLRRVAQAKKEPPPPVTVPSTPSGSKSGGTSSDHKTGGSSETSGTSRGSKDVPSHEAPKNGGTKGRTAEEIILAAVDRNEDKYLELVEKVFRDENLSPSESYQLQILMQQRQEMHSLLSNMASSFHEMSMSSINHIR